jgi:hypothetical protein
MTAVAGSTLEAGGMASHVPSTFGVLVHFLHFFPINFIFFFLSPARIMNVWLGNGNSGKY